MSDAEVSQGIKIRPPVVFFGAVIVLITFVIAKRIIFPQILIFAGAFLCAMTYFVLGRLPKSEHALYALAAYLPFANQLSDDAGNFPPLGFVVALLLLLAGISSYFENKKEFVWMKKSPLHFPFILFLGFGIVSVVHAVFLKHAPGDFAAKEFFLNWLLPFLFFHFFFALIRSREASENSTVIIAMASAAVSMLAIFEFLDKGDVSSLEKARVGGIANDPNVLAAFLNYTMMLPMALLMKDKSKFQKGAWLLAFLLGLRALLGTFSRGGYLAFGVGIYAAAFLMKKRLLIPLLIATSLLALHPKFLPSSMRERIAQTFEHSADPSVTGVEQNLDKSNRDRIGIWKGSIQIIKEHPVFGIGYTLFKTTIKDYWPGRVPFEPHNMYLFIAAEMGIPALAAYLWMLIVLARETFRIYKSTPSLFGKALSLGFWAGAASLLTSQLYVIRLDGPGVSGYFWILAGLLMGLIKMEESKAPLKKEYERV